MKKILRYTIILVLPFFLNSCLNSNCKQVVENLEKEAIALELENENLAGQIEKCADEIMFDNKYVKGEIVISTNEFYKNGLIEITNSNNVHDMASLIYSADEIQEDSIGLRDVVFFKVSNSKGIVYATDIKRKVKTVDKAPISLINNNLRSVGMISRHLFYPSKDHPTDGFHKRGHIQSLDQDNPFLSNGVFMYKAQIDYDSQDDEPFQYVLLPTLPVNMNRPYYFVIEYPYVIENIDSQDYYHVESYGQTHTH